MATDTDNFEELERSFPLQSGIATHRAYQQALASGQKVLVAKGGQLIEVSADGGTRVLRQIQPDQPVAGGKFYTIP
jgi:hypothetical protein